jgi:hypothetical protein
VPLDHPVILELMVHLVKTVRRVILARMPLLVIRKLQFPNSARAKAVLVNEVLPDPPDNLVHLEGMEATEMTVLLVRLAKTEDRAQRVQPVDLDPRDLPEPLDNKPMEDLDQPAMQEAPAHKDPLDQTDNPVNLVLVDKDHPAHKDHPDLLVSPEPMADLDPLDHLEALVALAPATTARHLDWPLDTKRNDAGRGLDTASFCIISGFLKATLYSFSAFLVASSTNPFFVSLTMYKATKN